MSEDNLSELERAPYRQTREQFENVFRLHEKQPWTKRKMDELFALLQECDTEDERQLVVDLLTMYENFDEERSDRAFTTLKDQIISTWGLSPASTYIVALHNKNKPGSGQALIQQFKNYFPDSKWKFFTTASSALTALREGTNIVFVDDFVGTGKTFTGLLTWFTQHEQLRGSKIGNIYLTSLCIMNLAVPIIEKQNVTHYASLYMDKAIHDRFSGDELDRVCRIMNKLENKLHWKNNAQRDQYSFGYEQSEALFRFMENNCPNNNFPIFWWRTAKDNTYRNTIQRRL